MRNKKNEDNERNRCLELVCVTNKRSKEFPVKFLHHR